MNYYQNYGYSEQNGNDYPTTYPNYPVSQPVNHFSNLQYQQQFLMAQQQNFINHLPIQIPFQNYFLPQQLFQQPLQQQNVINSHRITRRMVPTISDQPKPSLRRSERLKKNEPIPEAIADPATKAKNYKVGKKLGEGAFSKVYFAKSLRHQTDVALKKIEMDKLSQKYTELCLNEVRLLKAVNSPYVVKFLDSYPQNQGKILCVVLEYMDSGDLSNLIETCRHRCLIFSEQTVWHYFHQICAGLFALHEKRILHRDLKPANIFLKADGRCKLGDLGLSKLFNKDSNIAGTRVGTEYYFSPERNAIQGYHFKSDIWSLGCLLFEMCTLRSPFNGETSNAYSLHAKIAQGNLPPFTMKNYSKYIKYFINCCMSVNPDNRPTAEDCRNASSEIWKGYEILMKNRKNAK